MELQFDKEIDAILRKARSGIGVTKINADHLDADTIAAFAENALPEKAKLLYSRHIADCDGCRKHLAFAMQLSDEAEAASPVSAPAAATLIPWYQTFFKAPNLALAMGALVLAFSGVLGYLVIQNKKASDRATVSQVKEQEQPRGGANPNELRLANAAPANVMAPSDIATAANTTANSATAMSGRGPNSGLDTVGRLDSDQAKPDAARENNYQLDGAGAPAAAAPVEKSVAAKPPVTTTEVTDSTLGAKLEGKSVEDDRQVKEESKDNLAKAKQKRAEDRGYRDEPRAASKVGPSRGVVGPAQNQANQMNNQMPVTRVVGGKTFNNSNGAWYDSAYQNQTTLDYRRGTAEYKKLDSGLRNIADTLGGTVVVMWKSKAYRIQ